MSILKFVAAAAVAGCAALLAVPASAAPVLTSVNADLTTAPFTFSFDGGAFTFSSTGDIFNPLAVQTGGTGEVSSFGGFLGIPLTPTSDFIDRGTVVFGPGAYAAFPTTTTVPFSNGDNFIGLKSTAGGSDFFGFAYTNNTTLVSYGFETVAGQAITATTAIPEPGTWALMIVGAGFMGGMLRRARSKGGALQATAA